MKNPMKTWIFMTLLSLGFLILGHSIGDRQGTLVAFMICLGLLFVVFFYGDLRILSLYACEELEGQDSWGIIEIVFELSKDLNIPSPRIFLTNQKTPYVFGAGRDWKRGLIILSTGAIERLTRDELRALFAIALCQIRRLDTLSFGVGGAMAASLMNPARWLDNILSYVLYRKINRIEIFQKICAPFAALIIRLSVSKSGYFDADLAAAKTIEQSDHVANALWKLQSFSNTLPAEIPLTTAHFFIVNPLTSKTWNRYFHIQPPVSVRIQRLVGRFPI